MNRNSQNRSWRAALAVALALTGPAVAATPQDGLSEAELRGRQLYRQGTSAHGHEVIAKVGAEAVVLPASAVPCASCHGRDGRGRPEGGVIPPDIRWSELAKTYGHVHPDGRKHPAFDEESLAVSIRSGLDPAGNRLDRTMPTYAMTEQDMDDLVAYLKRLEEDRDPGIHADRLQIAALLPLRGPHAGIGQAMAQVLHGYFEDVNANGGVFQRRIDLLVVPHGTSTDETLDRLRQAMEQEGIFALVGAYTAGMDEPLLELLRKDYVPLVGPFTLDHGDEILNTGAFYIYSGLDEQARAMAVKALGAGDRRAAAPLLLVGPQTVRAKRLIDEARAELEARRAAAPEVLTYPAGQPDVAALTERLGDDAAERSVLFFGAPDELYTVLRGLAEQPQVPGVFLLGTYGYQALFDAPAAFDGRLFLAYPTLPSDVTDAGRAEYQDLSERYALPPGHVQGQLTALTAAKLFVEGLKRSGRELTRESLERAIEDLYAFQTGVTPPLTYGPTRRVGARGAHFMVVDLQERKQQPAGPWLDLR